MTTPGRRDLQFQGLDQVMADVDRLLVGHDTVGRWSLGLACNHLTKAVVGSVDGYGFKAPWLIRKLVTPLAWRRILGSGRMPEGVKVPGSHLAESSLDARAEAEALRAALRGFASHTGAMADHPFFGPLSKDDYEKFHRIHCAHHLSFARPLTTADAGAPG